MTDLDELEIRNFSVWPTAPDEGGFVYFWFCAAPVSAIKIGHARDIATRHSGAQTDCPVTLHPAAWFYSKEPKHDEGLLHSRFRHLRIRGEWFRADDELRAVVIHCRQIMDEVRLSWTLPRSPVVDIPRRPSVAVLPPVPRPPTRRRGFWVWRGKERPL